MTTTILASDAQVKDQYIVEYITLLQKDFKLKSDLEFMYPEIKVDLFSYTTNPNCSCKAKISSLVHREYAKLSASVQAAVHAAGKTFVVAPSSTNTVESVAIPPTPQKAPTLIPPVVIDSGPSTPSFTDEQAMRMLKPFLPPNMWDKYTNVIGDIVEIDADPHKYKELIQDAAQNWFYNGMNIIEFTETDEKNTTRKLWRIFFY